MRRRQCTCAAGKQPIALPAKSRPPNRSPGQAWSRPPATLTKQITPAGMEPPIGSLTKQTSLAGPNGQFLKDKTFPDLPASAPLTAPEQQHCIGNKPAGKTFVTVFQPAFFVLPGQQLTGNRQMRLVNKMRLVLLVQLHQPLHILYLIDQPPDRQLACYIDKDGMGGKAAKVFQFHLERTKTHGDSPKTLNYPLFHQFQLRKPYKRQVWFAAYCRWGLVGLIKFFFYALDPVAQLLPWVKH